MKSIPDINRLLFKQVLNKFTGDFNPNYLQFKYPICDVQFKQVKGMHNIFLRIYNRGVLDVGTKRWKSINSVTGSSYIEYNNLWYLYLYSFFTIGGHRKRSHSSLLILLDDHPHCRFTESFLLFFSAQRGKRRLLFSIYSFYYLFNVVGFTDFFSIYFLETKESKKRLKTKKQTIPE